MPRKLVRAGTQSLTANDEPGERSVATWQAAALTVAVIASAMFYGLGALLGAGVVVPVIYGLSRLRAYAPDARSTAEMIGATLGWRAATAAGIIQLCAYVVLAATFASNLGLQLLQAVSSPIDPAKVLAWLPACAIVPIVIGGVVVCLASTRALASLVAVLAAAGVLVYVYLAVAVTARIAAGSEPLVIGTASTPAHLSGQVVGFGLAMVGVEVNTVRNAQVAAPTRSMSLAVAVVAAAAVMLWVGDHRGVAGPWRWTAKHLVEAVPQLYAAAGQLWMVVGAVSLGAAGLLATAWGAVRVAGGLAIMRENAPSFRLQLAVLVVIGVIAAVISAYVSGGRWVAMVIVGAAFLLLIALYVFVSEANSRLPGDSVVAWWVRLVMPALGLIAVCKPIIDSHFALLDVATVIAAAAGVCAAGLAAALLAPVHPRTVEASGPLA